MAQNLVSVNLETLEWIIGIKKGVGQRPPCEGGRAGGGKRKHLRPALHLWYQDRDEGPPCEVARAGGRCEQEEASSTTFPPPAQV